MVTNPGDTECEQQEMETKNEWKNLRVVAGSSQLFHSELLFSGSLPSIAASENFIFHSTLVVVSTYLQSGVSAQMAKAASRSTTQWPCAFVNFGHCTGAANLVSWQWPAKTISKISQVKSYVKQQVSCSCGWKKEWHGDYWYGDIQPAYLQLCTL